MYIVHVFSIKCRLAKRRFFFVSVNFIVFEDNILYGFFLLFSKQPI